MFKGIAVSNIAWSPQEEVQARDLLLSSNISAVEVAPARVISNFNSIDKSEIKKYKTFWNSCGINIVSMQALLFGGPGGNIFGNKQEKDLVKNHLFKVITIAELLGAKKLVFGSPKNRFNTNYSQIDCINVAAEFFHELALKCVQHGVKLCIEPNPKYYGCNFVNTSEEAFILANKVDSDGFGVHLDSAGMWLAEENISKELKRFGSLCSHFHVSQKDLAPISDGEVPHELFKTSLNEGGYSGWLSIEMLRAANGLESVKKSVEIVKRIYL